MAGLKGLKVVSTAIGGRDWRRFGVALASGAVVAWLPGLKVKLLKLLWWAIALPLLLPVAYDCSFFSD